MPLGGPLYPAHVLCVIGQKNFLVAIAGLWCVHSYCALICTLCPVYRQGVHGNYYAKYIGVRNLRPPRAIGMAKYLIMIMIMVTTIACQTVGYMVGARGCNFHMILLVGLAWYVCIGHTTL